MYKGGRIHFYPPTKFITEKSNELKQKIIHFTVKSHILKLKDPFQQR